MNVKYVLEKYILICVLDEDVNSDDKPTYPLLTGCLLALLVSERRVTPTITMDVTVSHCIAVSGFIHFKTLLFGSK